MARYALQVNFFIESEEDDPEEIATEFMQGLGFGAPVLVAAEQFPGGSVMSADVVSIREATEEEITTHFQE